MKTNTGHLSYCTNIHPGEDWPAHFAQLRENIPAVKAAVSPDKPFGIGLRLSDKASLELSKEPALNAFKAWLKEQDCYVFTMNGFPYGGFHHTVVKDNVHTPDWTEGNRVEYTNRLFRILAALLPSGMEGGISTSPLSYRPWRKPGAMENGTLNMLPVLEQLIRIHRSGGPLMHLDIEPEPDGLLENSQEFIDWYFSYLLPLSVPSLADKFNISEEAATALVKQHIRLCYDVCHFALVYESPAAVLAEMKEHGLLIGKLQISAALKATAVSENRSAIVEAFSEFNEPTYLHQVIARCNNGTLAHYPDLPQALAAAHDHEIVEWRSHFHVPVFVEEYGVLTSTQSDIRKVLQLQQEQPFTQHMEVETYTWDVLPADLKLPIDQSIARELNWVKAALGE
jgi:hypothetical protein